MPEQKRSNSPRPSELANRPAALAVVTVLVATMASARTAHAQRPRLLIDAPGAIVDATTSTLTGWTIESVDVALPSDHHASPGTAPAVIVSLARNRRARAVAWLIPRPDGVILIVYHAGRDHTVSRTLPTRPPYNSAGAAAIALSLKSLLRQSERDGPEDGDDPRAPRPDSPSSHFPGRVAVSLGLGVRAPAVDSTQLNADLAVVWALGQTPLALAPRVAVGARQDIAMLTPGNIPFVGQMDGDYEAGLDVRWSPWTWRRTRVEFLGGGFVKWRRVTGQLASRPESMSETHISPGWQVGARVDVRIRKLFLELAVDGRLASEPAGVTSSGEMVYTQASWAIQTGLGVRLALFGMAGG